MQLIPMNEETFRNWLERFIPHYGQEHVRTGRWSAEKATYLAKGEIDQALPEGLLTKDHYFFSLVTEDLKQPVGMVWFSIRSRPSGKRSIYIYNIEIDEPFRRHGYASEAFHMLEIKAQESGANEIALHVFGHNFAARALYEKLGYETTSLYMAKQLRLLKLN